jgi:hypothetical protein
MSLTLQELERASIELMETSIPFASSSSALLRAIAASSTFSSNLPGHHTSSTTTTSSATTTPNITTATHSCTDGYGQSQSDHCGRLYSRKFEEKLARAFDLRSNTQNRFAMLYDAMSDDGDNDSDSDSHDSVDSVNSATRNDLYSDDVIEDDGAVVYISEARKHTKINHSLCSQLQPTTPIPPPPPPMPSFTTKASGNTFLPLQSDTPPASTSTSSVSYVGSTQTQVTDI